MPSQITRLTLLTVAIIAAYVIARYLLTPESFAEFGWYRGLALGEIAAQQPLHPSQKACEECHQEEIEKLSKAEHKTISCISCHGEVSAHVANPDDAKIPKLGDALCLRCHTADPARPAWLKQIVPAKHYTGDPCTECHVPHQPNEVP